MAVTKYTVKRGDTLWGICSSSLGKNISGSTINAKINTLVRLNNIANRNLIYVGQVLKLTSTSSSTSSTSKSSSSTSSTSTKPKITTLALDAGDTTGRAMYATWSFSRSKVKEYQIQWSQYKNGRWNAENLETVSYTSAAYLYSTYSADEAATAVKVRVKAVSGTSSWKSVWSSEKIYYFKNNPPFPPGAPELEIDNDTLKATASITFDTGEVAKLYAKEIQFQIIKNNSINLGTVTATINTTGDHVSAMFNVAAGGEYRIRARSKNGTKYSTWSDYSNSVGTKPESPGVITTCRANSYSNNEVTAYLEWPEVTNAETYEIEYTTNKNYFDGSDGTTSVTGITFNHYEITSLELGHEYFFRVRAINQNGESDWSEITSTKVGIKPVAPTTWSSTTTAIVGEPLNLYWVHNAEDNSSQTRAELRLYIDNVLQEPDITIINTEDPEERDKTSVYSIDTTDYPEGTQIKWQVRTAGIYPQYGDWSIERVIDIYAKPTIDLAVTDSPDGTGNVIDILSSFPFYIYALPGPKTQSPIGYHLKVVANEFYETVNENGTAKMINKGDAVYSKYFDTTETLIVEMSADNIDLQPDIEYTITCKVTMNSGLSTEASHDFVPSWDEVTYNVDADVTVNYETLTATITPYSESIVNYRGVVDNYIDLPTIISQNGEIIDARYMGAIDNYIDLPSVKTPKGVIDNYSDLPSSGEYGDTYMIVNASEFNEADDSVMWNGTEWEILTSPINLNQTANINDIYTVINASDFNEANSNMIWNGSMWDLAFNVKFNNEVEFGDSYTVTNASDFNEAGDVLMWNGYNWEILDESIDLNEQGTLIEDLTLSVYRREFDGTFTELGTDIPNDNSVSITDPHPALDFARYRIVAKSKSTGAISYHDIAGVEVGGKSVIIQWDQDWSIFNTTDEYDAERPAWSGSLLSIPYNIDVSSSYSVETELVNYIGRKRPVSYYGTQLGETATWNVEIPATDKDALYAIRRLAIWTGDVYVREPSGTGYWANISVSYNQTHNAVTIPVTFAITRVEGGV